MNPLPHRLRHHHQGVLGLLCCLFLLASGLMASEAQILRIGYFPNVTHAQGVIGAQGTREGKGWFEEKLGNGITLQWFAYNAGPSAMEALLAGSIDLTYVGPNPALNAYIRSRGSEIRILSGSAEGGAALVISKDSNITRPADFKGCRLATPQLGNTQDVAARAWLKQQGFQVTLTGGDVMVIPTANPDQLGLMKQGKLEAVWTVEPWVSRLEMETGAQVFLEQKDAIVTVLVASTKALAERRVLVDAFVQAHRDLTAWLNAHPEQAAALVQKGLSAEMKREIPATLISSSWKRLHFTDKVEKARFESLVADAQSVGFLRNAIPLDKLFEYSK